MDIDWLCLLGQIEDDRLAEMVQSRFKVCVTHQLVSAIRNDLGVSAYSARKPKLLPGVIDLIGRYTPSNIAKSWDVSATTVEAYRLLADMQQAPQEHDDMPESGRWTQDSVALFARHTNAQIARATGIPTERVRAKRNELQIAAPAQRSYWKLVEDLELDAMGDNELATKYGGPVADYAGQRLANLLRDSQLAKLVLESRQLPEQLVRFLGVMPTRQLGIITGLTDFQINKQMAALSIPSYTAMSTELDALLGTCPDTAIAETFHVATSTVKNRRVRLGIPAFKRSSKLGLADSNQH
ncbi:hypothetical protein ACI77O_12685 [Pseudomonas tritici]|uniref:hypothetical protein n=1 Tax=Pseudomonas tritici TaxID=2745518 RepID=UPI00387AF477